MEQSINHTVVEEIKRRINRMRKEQDNLPWYALARRKMVGESIMNHRRHLKGAEAKLKLENAGATTPVPFDPSDTDHVKIVDKLATPK